MVVGRRGKLAGDGFEHIAHGDHALHFTVLVDHEHQLGAGDAEVLEQLHARQRLGHEHRVGQHVGQVGRLAARHRRQQALRRDHAQHFGQAAATDRVARVLVGGHQRQRFGQRCVDVEPGDLGARHHHRADLAVVEAKHVAHHLVLLLLDHAGVQALLEAGGNFLFGDAAVGPAANAEQAQHGHRAHRQQRHQRPRGRWTATASAWPPGGPPSRGRSGPGAWAPARRR